MKRSKPTFLELAARILRDSDTALTVGEIWDKATASNLDRELGSTGKTPVQTLGAQLYTTVKKPESGFKKIGARPAKFMLAETAAAATDSKLAADAIRTPMSTAKRSFTERDLHSVLVWFADRRLGASCRTVFHEKSAKRGSKHDEWVHPDIVGFSLVASDWQPPIVKLAQTSGAPLSRLFSFELKVAIDFPILRSSFFQAVSNSSWAHEGYLVASEIDEDLEFQEELRRLSQSFGIGVIHLDLVSPNDSRIVFPARGRDEIDWETANRIAEINPDFRAFMSAVDNSTRINQLATPDFDKVLDDDAFEKLLATFW